MDKIKGCSKETVTPYGVTMRQDINRCGNCKLSGSIECEIWIGGMDFTPFEDELYDGSGNLVTIKKASKHYHAPVNQKHIIEDHDPWAPTDFDREIDKFLIDNGFASKVCNLPGAETG